MLPTGHVAAGYLTAAAILKFTNPGFSESEVGCILWFGVFFGFAPDLDIIYFFIKHKTMLVSGKDSKEDSHRKYLSHAPVLWLIPALLVVLFAPSLYWKYVGLLFWLGSWSHFVLDSIDYGIMWLWPFSNQVYALKNRGVKLQVTETGLFTHSIGFLKLYSRRASFYLEVCIIICAIIIYLR